MLGRRSRSLRRGAIGEPANLTTRGLGPSLREFGSTSIEVNDIRRVLTYFERVWDAARIASQEHLKLALEQLEHMRLDMEQVRRVSDEAEKHFAGTAFAPRTPVESRGEASSGRTLHVIHWRRC
jgi:hypothetical protein